MYYPKALRKCPACDQFFEFSRGFNDNKKYCSKACVQRAYRARKVKARPVDKSYGFFIGNCHHCGSDMWGLNKRQLYCTGKCRVAACRRRKVENAQNLAQKGPNFNDSQIGAIKTLIAHFEQPALAGA